METPITQLKEVSQRKRRKETLPKSIKEEEFISLMKCVKEKDKQAKVSFLLAFASGLRLGEIKKLKQEDIRSNDVYIQQGKYSKDRIVPKPKAWRDWMLDILPIKKTGRSLERNFKSASLKAGLDSRYTFHSLRHGFATHSLRKGIPINVVQLLLGHSNVATTSVYIKADPQEALRRYEELF